MSGGGPLFVDVVIPFRRWDAWTAECLQATLALEPPCQRITLVPDEPLAFAECPPEKHNEHRREDQQQPKNLSVRKVHGKIADCRLPIADSICSFTL